MRIEALRQHRRGRGISELPQPIQFRAKQNLSRMIAKARARGRRLDSWYVALLCGVAKREALNPHGSEWGFSMKQRKAGLASQRSARREGRAPAGEPSH